MTNIIKLYEETFITKPNNEFKYYSEKERFLLRPHYSMKRVHNIKKILDYIFNQILNTDFPLSYDEFKKIKSENKIDEKTNEFIENIYKVHDFNKLKVFCSFKPFLNSLIDDMSSEKIEVFVDNFQKPVKNILSLTLINNLS